jgi:predicted ABC-type ATPase
MTKSPESTPRMRVFAGPNGSGKSRLKSLLRAELVGVYINPDEIEKTIKTEGFLDFKNFKVEVKIDEIVSHFLKSTLLNSPKFLEKSSPIDCARNISLQNQKLRFIDVKMNSYFASVISDFIRNKLIEIREDFTFETVMSSPDKIEFLKKAKRAGYKTYLYFLCTKSPSINISRVKDRFLNRGGHDVCEDKIISRYYRSLDLLKDAVKNSNRSYIFDNSEPGDINNPPPMLFVAEGHDGEILDAKVDEVPDWFDKYWIRKTAPF